MSDAIRQVHVGDPQVFQKMKTLHQLGLVVVHLEKYWEQVDDAVALVWDDGTIAVMVRLADCTSNEHAVCVLAQAWDEQGDAIMAMRERSGQVIQ